MQIHEVCKQCALTRKAVSYYEQQGLIQTQVLPNGYRDFSPDTVKRLKKIGILRGLGLSVAEIRCFLDEPETEKMRLVAHKALESNMAQRKQQLLRQLAQKGKWKSVEIRLEVLQRKETVLQRMMDAFPGFYGRYLAMHFAPYLDEPVTSSEQQQAFETVISFLDQVEVPSNLQSILEWCVQDVEETALTNFSEQLQQLTKDPQQYLTQHREMLEQYLNYRQSEAYRSSPLCQVQEFWKTFCAESGYHTVFIPAMKQLSRSYHAFHNALEKANQVFLEKYPQADFYQQS